MYGINEAKEEWKRHENNKGFISISPEEIVENIEDYDKKKEKQEALYGCMYFYETEWENEKEESWRFIN
ncbi:hypothetical protein [Tenacibaculum ovolyticum]|uniref:hypothetical protein n=1 Tax=Tenacibaculum ovolyticum TaxID=104270 RepID=UPI0007EE2544|nr:hypothetical protein [Tenacibaculum ovolyticum]